MKPLIVAFVVLGVLAGLSGCDNGEATREAQYEKRMDRLYSECIKAGGSFHQSAWDGSPVCEMPKGK